eukprot:360895-Chlamydomonas_euryale.AAC.4
MQDGGRGGRCRMEDELGDAGWRTRWEMGLRSSGTMVMRAWCVAEAAAWQSFHEELGCNTPSAWLA